MRPLFTLLIAIGLMSGIYAYTQFAESVRPEPIQYEADFSASKYLVRIHRTFDCAANPDFRIPNSLILTFKKKEYLRTEKIAAAEPIEFSLEGVEVGKNSINVVANLPSQLSMDFQDNPTPSFDAFRAKAHAMQIELLRDNQVIAAQTYWIDSGLDSVSGSLYFEIEESELKKELSQ